MQKILCCTRYSILQKLSNKQSAKVICKFDRLRTAHRKRQKPIGHWKGKCISAHAFDYIVLKVTLAWPVVKTLLQPCHLFGKSLAHEISSIENRFTKVFHYRYLTISTEFANYCLTKALKWKIHRSFTLPEFCTVQYKLCVHN